MQSGFITGKPKELVFYPEDPEIMFDAVRKVNKTCVVFKLFAGGQVFYNKTDEEITAAAGEAIERAYKNIKPGDFACVGVYQKHKDELRENAAFAEKALSG